MRDQFHGIEARPARRTREGQALGANGVAVQDPPRGTADAVKSAAAALEGFDGDVAILYGDAPLEERARAWLDINCSHCHNPAGPANTTALDLRSANADARLWGICKPPVAAGRATGDHLFDIVPGKPDDSILAYRITSSEPGVMMPETGRQLVDERGAAADAAADVAVGIADHLGDAHQRDAVSLELGEPVIG